MPSSKAKNSSVNSPHLISAKFYFCLGMIFLISYLAYHIHSMAKLSFSKPIIPPPIPTRTSKPAEISIDTVNINLPVYETTLSNNDIWEIAEDGVSHLDISGRPEENNTNILYAHNTNDRFGPLLWAKIGDPITITTRDNNNYSYIITDIQTVDPNQVDILTSHKDETLILYTCTGFADLKRYVVIAKP